MNIEPKNENVLKQLIQNTESQKLSENEILYKMKEYLNMQHESKTKQELFDLFYQHLLSDDESIQLYNSIYSQLLSQQPNNETSRNITHSTDDYYDSKDIDSSTSLSPIVNLIEKHNNKNLSSLLDEVINIDDDDDDNNEKNDSNNKSSGGGGGAQEKLTNAIEQLNITVEKRNNHNNNNNNNNDNDNNDNTGFTFIEPKRTKTSHNKPTEAQLEGNLIKPFPEKRLHGLRQYEFEIERPGSEFNTEYLNMYDFSIASYNELIMRQEYHENLNNQSSTTNQKNLANFQNFMGSPLKSQKQNFNQESKELKKLFKECQQIDEQLKRGIELFKM